MRTTTRTAHKLQATDRCAQPLDSVVTITAKRVRGDDPLGTDFRSSSLASFKKCHKRDSEALGQTNSLNRNWCNRYYRF